MVLLIIEHSKQYRLIYVAQFPQTKEYGVVFLVFFEAT